MLKLEFARVACGVIVTLLSVRASADDAPVERPSVTRPALPQQPSEPSVVERPATDRPVPAQRSAVRERRTVAPSTARPMRARRGERPFVYLGGGLGVVSGLSGGQAFERTNPALNALLGVEVPLGKAMGLGFELGGDLELTGSGERGEYSALSFRGRLSRMLTPRTRLWGALGLGRAGYESGAFAGTLAVGSSYLFGPRFGLDLSGNLHLVGAASDAPTRANPDYRGGAVLLFQLRALFELRPAR